jgi:hypothetical protein
LTENSKFGYLRPSKREELIGELCSTERRGVHRVLVGKPEGRRLLGRPRCRWKDNIKIYLQEVEWERMVWIDLAQDTGSWRETVNAVMNLRVS